MPEFDLFAAEKSIIQDISLALQQGHLDIEDARGLLEKLLGHYERLLRETQQLIKISDRKARELNRLNHKLQQVSRDLAFQATHDALTGVYNKGAISEIIQDHLSMGDFVLILFDIDHFKKVNDTHGHSVGDQVLRLVANLVEENIKHKDYIGRFGGEEFVVLLSDTPLKQSIEMAGTLLTIIEGAALMVEDVPVKVTVSMGLTPCKKNEPFEEVYIRVDKLLYAAKKGGRNRIEVRI